MYTYQNTILSLIHCQICFLNVKLTYYILLYIFSITSGIIHFVVISFYPCSMLAIPEIFCAVHQNLKMRAVSKNHFFHFINGNRD